MKEPEKLFTRRYFLVAAVIAAIWFVFSFGLMILVTDFGDNPDMEGVSRPLKLANAVTTFPAYYLFVDWNAFNAVLGRFAGYVVYFAFGFSSFLWGLLLSFLYGLWLRWRHGDEPIPGNASYDEVT